MKVLIVDDVEMNRELLGVFLWGRAETIQAESGEEALRLVEAALQEERHFDLICMDIGLPGINGHEALRRIREMEVTYGTNLAKVFMVTGSSSPEDMLDALFVGGCDDYLTKPLMRQSFMDLLHKHGLLS